MHTKAPIIVTNKAISHLKSLVAENNNKATIGIRLSIKTGGCSGYSYCMDYAYNSTTMDEIIDFDGIKLLIDKKAILFIIGTTMDYAEDTFKSGFVFNNPKEKTKCGCGKSIGF